MELQSKAMFYEGIGTEPRRYGGKFKTLDWKKAREICEANPNSTIKVGIVDDWYYTHAVIFDKGEYITEDGSECGICVSSYHGTPVLVIDNGDPIECNVLTNSWEPGFPKDWIR